MSAGRPNRWTGQIARVRGVIAASIRAASMQYVSGSMSTKTGVAPVDRIELTVALNVWPTVMTSSPGPSPRPCEDAHQRHGPVADRDRVLDADECGEALLELGDPACPAASIPLWRTSVTAAISSGPMSGRAIGIMRRLLVDAAGAARSRASRRLARRRSAGRRRGQAARGRRRIGRARPARVAARVDEPLAADADPADAAGRDCRRRARGRRRRASRPRRRRPSRTRRRRRRRRRPRRRRSRRRRAMRIGLTVQSSARARSPVDVTAPAGTGRWSGSRRDR